MYVSTNRLGTAEYMAPEISLCDAEMRDRAQREKVSLYGKEVDCWAIGILAYECLFKTMPWELEGISKKDWLTRICAQGVNFNPSVSKGGEPRRRSRRVISPEAKDFISSCLALDPASRLTARQMLWHPWITRGIVEAGTEHTRGAFATSAANAAGGNETARAAAASDTSGQRQQPTLPFRAATLDVRSSSSRFAGGHTAQHGELVNGSIGEAEIPPIRSASFNVRGSSSRFPGGHTARLGELVNGSIGEAESLEARGNKTARTGVPTSMPIMSRMIRSISSILRGSGARSRGAPTGDPPSRS